MWLNYNIIELLILEFFMLKLVYSFGRNIVLKIGFICLDFNEFGDGGFLNFIEFFLLRRSYFIFCFCFRRLVFFCLNNLKRVLKVFFL